jgi:hypothetical protein
LLVAPWMVWVLGFHFGLLYALQTGLVHGQRE